MSETSSSSSFTPGRNFPLYLPAGTGAQFQTALAAMPAVPEPEAVALLSEPGREERPERRSAPSRSYLVRAGDTLRAAATAFTPGSSTASRMIS